jgi:putative endonuclease
MTKQPAVYTLASKRNGTLYIGVTSDLQKRTWEHKDGRFEGFTRRYGVHNLVCYELHAVCYHSGEADEEVESGLEAGSHQEAQSRLEGLVV